MIIALLLSTLAITACSSDAGEEGGPEEAEAEETFISEYTAKGVVDKFEVSAIGQWTGFITARNDVKVYPYYNRDAYVEVRYITTSTSTNFWYDFISTKGFKLSDVKFLAPNFMTVDNYGYCYLGDNSALFFSVKDVPTDYIPIVASHVILHG